MPLLLTPEKDCWGCSLDRTCWSAAGDKSTDLSFRTTPQTSLVRRQLLTRDEIDQEISTELDCPPSLPPASGGIQGKQKPQSYNQFLISRKIRKLMEFSCPSYVFNWRNKREKERLSIGLGSGNPGKLVQGRRDRKLFSTVNTVGV